MLFQEVLPMRRIRHRLRFVLFVLSVSFLADGPAVGQDDERLSGKDARELYRRVADLMDATSFAAPELARAGAPLIENARQSARALRVGNTREHSGVQYRLLANARIFLQIADVVPKPKSFAEEIGGQLTDLRQAVERLSAHFRATLEHKENIVRGSDRDQLARYTEDNSQLNGVGAVENRVVFFGDSITDGWPLNQYFPGRPYVNRGIGGQITSQMLGRMQADVIALQPAVVVILAGTNDLARGVPFDTIKNNLAMIASLSAAHGITPVFASLLPVSDHHKQNDPNYERSGLRPPRDILSLNRWIRDFCTERGLIYLDYHSKMTDAEGQLRAELADDGLHPNDEGYKVMGSLARTAIGAALQSRGKKKRKKRLGLF